MTILSGSQSFAFLNLIKVEDGCILEKLYGRCTHGRHPRVVGSLGLFLSLSRLGFVHGAHGDQGMCSLELIMV